MQIADGGAAEVQGLGGEAAAALAGQEGRDVGAGGGQGREVAFPAPVAPGAHRGAVGPAGVLGLGHAGVGLGGLALGRERAVERRRRGLDHGVEPGADGGRTRRRAGRPGGAGQGGAPGSRFPRRFPPRPLRPCRPPVALEGFRTTGARLASYLRQGHLSEVDARENRAGEPFSGAGKSKRLIGCEDVFRVGERAHA